LPSARQVTSAPRGVSRAGGNDRPAKWQDHPQQSETARGPNPEPLLTSARPSHQGTRLCPAYGTLRRLQHPHRRVPPRGKLRQAPAATAERRSPTPRASARACTAPKPAKSAQSVPLHAVKPCPPPTGRAAPPTPKRDAALVLPRKLRTCRSAACATQNVTHRPQPPHSAM